jgi:hypothetical protein
MDKVTSEVTNHPVSHSEQSSGSAKWDGRALLCGDGDRCGHSDLDGSSQAYYQAEDHTLRCDPYPQPLPRASVRPADPALFEA